MIMKKVVAWILVLAMTAAISVGVTLAFMQDTDEDVNVMTMGNVKIDQLEFERTDVDDKDEDAKVQEFHNDKPLYPAVLDDDFDWNKQESYVKWDDIGKTGYRSDIWNPDKINNELDKMVFVKNKGDYGAYVRSVFAFEVNGYSYDEFKANFHLNLNTIDWTWTWVETPVAIGETNYIIAVATYNRELLPGAITEISLEQIALDPKANNADVEGFGDTYQVLVKSQAIQSDGFFDPGTALNTGFGPVDARNYPFDNDNPTLGTDLRTALHYLNGDGVTWIADDIDLVVFGNVNDYKDIALSNAGTLVDDEQEVEVKSYYVKDVNDRYIVYFLASDTIYTPKDSSDLFANMNYLETVITENMSVKKTENMHGMFTSCHSLTHMDVSHWDTSNVSDMSHMFSFCTYLDTLDLTMWDVSNVTNMDSMFFMDPTDNFGAHSQLTDLDVSTWDVSNVTNMANMFRGCTNLISLDVSKWDVGNVTTMERMFSDCMALKDLPLEKWDVSSCTTLQDMFVNCTAIPSMDLTGWDVSNVTNLQGTFTSLTSCTKLDVTGWNTSNVTNMHQTFWNCRSLSTIEGLSEWDTSNVTTMRGLFGLCGYYSDSFYVDVSKFDTSKVVNMSRMFYSCNSQVTGYEYWDTSNVTNMYRMFCDCGTITELDLSRWDTSKVTDMMQMFYYSNNLKTIYVSDLWSNESVVDSRQMFRDCHKLVGGNGTAWSSSKVTAEYACVDGENTPGYFTHIDDKPKE